MQLKGPLRSVILGLFAKLRKATIRCVMSDFKVVLFFLYINVKWVLRGLEL